MLLYPRTHKHTHWQVTRCSNLICSIDKKRGVLLCAVASLPGLCLFFHKEHSKRLKFSTAVFCCACVVGGRTHHVNRIPYYSIISLVSPFVSCFSLDVFGAFNVPSYQRGLSKEHISLSSAIYSTKSFNSLFLIFVPKLHSPSCSY